MGAAAQKVNQNLPNLGFEICNIRNSSVEALSSFALNIKDIAKIVIRRFLSNLYINFRLNVSVIRHLVILPFS